MKKLIFNQNHMALKKEDRANWRDFHPPLIPIYHIEIEALRKLLEKDENVTDDALELMLGYFEEYEKYEKAALVRDEMWKRGNMSPKTAEINMDKWTLSPDGRNWIKPATDEEIEEYLKSSDDDLEPA